MKKTLLALAVVAASGAAFAQSATLSGSYVFGYQSTKVAGARTAGLGTDTAAISLSATEDLGGGLKASAQVSLGGMMRDGAGTGEDAKLTLSGGFGTLTLSTFESDDGLSRAYAGAPVIGLDGKVHGANSNIDLLGYTSPQLAPGLTVGYSYVDRGTTVGTGLAAGTTGAAVAQPSHTGNVTYGAGPISARFDVASWTRQGDATVTANTNKNRFRVSGNYDLGMAKIGLGYSSLKRTTGTTAKQTEIGVSAPLGATTVGLVYEKLVNSGVTTSGVTFGAQYNLSKRTNVSAGYAQWKKTGAATTDNSFRVLVGHSF
jgi:Gram-negative porin